TEPADPLEAEDLALVQAAGAGSGVAWSPGRHRAAFAFAARPDAPVLLLDFAQPRADWALPAAFADALRIADRQMWPQLALASQLDSIAGLEHAEKLQRALFAIADLSGSEHDMPKMLSGIHGIIASLMFAENFFIVLHDAERASIR